MIKLDMSQETKRIQEVKQAEELANDKSELNSLDINNTSVSNIFNVSSGIVKDIAKGLEEEGKDFMKIEGYDKITPPKKKKQKDKGL
jgi:hypothetical protein